MSWPNVSLAEVATVNPRLPKEIDEAQEVSFVAMASVSEEGWLLSEEIRVLSETRKGFTYFEKDDVLLAKITPCFENGKCLRPGQIANKIGFGSTEFHVLRADPKRLNSQYLFYMVWSDKFRRLGESSMSGAAGQKRVSTDFLKSFEIPLPPLTEQKRIAAILDKADAIRRKRQQAIQLADEFLRSVFLDMFGDFVDSGWKQSSVEKIASKKGGLRTGPFGSQLLHSEFVESGISVLGIDNAVDNSFKWGKQRFITPEKYEKLKKYTVYPGDVLITIMGTCGRCAVVPEDIPVAVNTKHLCCITVDASKCLPDYLHAFFLYHKIARNYLKAATKGAIMDGLNMGVIKEMPILLPPLKLQHKFSAIKKKQRSTLGTMSESDASSLFGSISSRLFSGSF